MTATQKKKSTTTATKNRTASKVVIHMGAGVHELTITDPSSPTLRNHTVSLNGATRKQKEAVVVACVHSTWRSVMSRKRLVS